MEAPPVVLQAAAINPSKRLKAPKLSSTTQKTSMSPVKKNAEISTPA